MKEYQEVSTNLRSSNATQSVEFRGPQDGKYYTVITFDEHQLPEGELSVNEIQQQFITLIAQGQYKDSISIDNTSDYQGFSSKIILQGNPKNVAGFLSEVKYRGQRLLSKQDSEHIEKFAYGFVDEEYPGPVKKRSV